MIANCEPNRLPGFQRVYVRHYFKVYARLREANLEESLCAQLAEANAARWFKDELSEEEIKALNAYLRNRAE